ncbi:nitroreductase [Ramlibacter albus]|uniref:Nitroreductase n=1 Tax=Ramlibacter albus TaxID=2079448 RepID=A0A923MD08_9BURK|nr:nitroreductase [Ramlibacter albus]MBC5767054.1 nitroreductase [Ramlibacter albus]
MKNDALPALKALDAPDALDPSGFERLLATRASCRGFLPTPLPRPLIERILAATQRTASWNNTQPWQVIVTDAPATESLRQALQSQQPEPAGFEIPPPAEYRGVYLERRRACGWGLYAAVGVAKGDREASQRQANENFRMFGAPHLALLTSDKALGTYGVLDCGGWVNNFLLAAASHGVATIAQAALAQRSAFLRRWFGIPEDRTIVCGISFGYADTAHPANSFRTPRAPLAEVVRWVDQ